MIELRSLSRAVVPFSRLQPQGTPAELDPPNPNPSPNTNPSPNPEGTPAELADVSALNAALGARFCFERISAQPPVLTLTLALTLTRTRTRTRTRTQNLQAQPPGRTRATDAARAAAAPCWVWGAGPHGGEGGYGDPWVWGGDASDGAVEATVRSPRGPRDRATVSERTLAQALALTLTLPLTLA